MDEAVMSPLSSWWRATMAKSGAPRALAQLCVQLGERMDRDTAAFLAAQALDLTPGSIEALELYEWAVRGLDPRALRARYEGFLATAAHEPGAQAVRERLTALLFRHGAVYTALWYVDATLRELGEGSSKVEVCGLMLAEREADACLDELERQLAAEAPYQFAEAAE